jgi:hypothetical protein
MGGKLTYNELERKNRQLEKEVLEYIRKAKELNKKRKVTERSHIRRTLSLMHIIEEQDRERRWTPKTGQGAKLYVRVLKGGTDNGKNQKKAQSKV